MIVSRLTHLLRQRRDNDVVAGDAHSEITGVRYDPVADQVVLVLDDDRIVKDIVKDLVGLMYELDQGLRRHDVGHSVWYAEWRQRVVATIGVSDAEVSDQ